MKGLEYLDENKMQVRFGESKEAVRQREEARMKTEREHVAAEPEMKQPVVEEEPEVETAPRSYGLTLGAKFKNMWEKLLEATDEQLDDNSGK